MKSKVSKLTSSWMKEVLDSGVTVDVFNHLASGFGSQYQSDTTFLELGDELVSCWPLDSRISDRVKHSQPLFIQGNDFTCHTSRFFRTILSKGRSHQSQW